MAGRRLAAKFDCKLGDKNGDLDGAATSGSVSGTGCTMKRAACASNTTPAKSKFPPLSGRGKAADSNKDGLIQESEARGPLAANFDDMDCDKNGGLDGAEISGFFSGSACPKKQPAAASTTTPAKSKFPPLSGLSSNHLSEPPRPY